MIERPSRRMIGLPRIIKRLVLARKNHNDHGFDEIMNLDLLPYVHENFVGKFRLSVLKSFLADIFETLDAFENYNTADERLEPLIRRRLKKWVNLFVNEELKSVYLDVNEKVYKYITEKNKQPDCEQAAYPFFLNVPDGFMNSKNKIIVYGQEACGWSDVNNNKAYKKYRTPFWNIFRLTEDYFCEYSSMRYYKELADNESGFFEFGLLWNNINKLGLNGSGFPYTWHENIIKPYFNAVIKQEIEIIEPDFIIFYTGKSGDFLIDEIFDRPERKAIKGFAEDEMCEFVIPRIKKALRAEDPITLYKNSSKGSYRKIIQRVVEEITSEMEATAEIKDPLSENLELWYKW